MNETAPRVIKIPAKPESVRQAELQRQLRVAAYCRVSTKEEDQANSYEVSVMPLSAKMPAIVHAELDMILSV